MTLQWTHAMPPRRKKPNLFANQHGFRHRCDLGGCLHGHPGSETTRQSNSPETTRQSHSARHKEELTPTVITHAMRLL